MKLEKVYISTALWTNREKEFMYFPSRQFILFLPCKYCHIFSPTILFRYKLTFLYLLKIFIIHVFGIDHWKIWMYFLWIKFSWALYRGIWILFWIKSIFVQKYYSKYVFFFLNACSKIQQYMYRFCSYILNLCMDLNFNILILFLHINYAIHCQDQDIYLN